MLAVCSVGPPEETLLEAEHVCDYPAHNERQQTVETEPHILNECCCHDEGTCVCKLPSAQTPFGDWPVAHSIDGTGHSAVHELRRSSIATSAKNDGQHYLDAAKRGMGRTVEAPEIGLFVCIDMCTDMCVDMCVDK